MWLPWALVLGGALVHVVGADGLFARQILAATSSFGPLALPSELEGPSSSSLSPSSTTTLSSSSSTSPSDSASSSDAADTTVTTTVTVSGAQSTVTKFITRTSEFVETSTVFSTDVVTQTGETATSIVFVTSTSFVNRKRTLDASLARRTYLPRAVPAQPTAVPTTEPMDDDNDRKLLFKRATVTSTVTVKADGGSPVTTTIERVSSAISTSLTTVVVTQTSQVNARNTVTSTSTLVVTSTRGSTEAVPTNGNSPQGARREGAGGLSPGAKAGIGVGAGLGGLALVAVAAYLCFRRQRGPKPYHDDLIGASEVPVVGPAPVGRRPMAQTTAPPNRYQAASLGHSHPKTNSRPEGYRGTAIGDGRAGFAHPTPYGAAYAAPQAAAARRSSSKKTAATGADMLPQHPTPDDSTAAWPLPPDETSEMDGRPVRKQPTGPVYEMA